MLNATKITGGDPKHGRVDNDWYQTNPEAVNKLLSVQNFKMKNILEPCVGTGNIANLLKEYSGERVTALDIVDRGYRDTIVTDFLNWQPDKKYDTIITNPPYSLASEFIKKCFSVLTPDGKLAMFLKIQFLEGIKRKELFDTYPPTYVYVFRKRMPTFRAGVEINPDTGKKWNTLLCNAWFIWEKSCNGEPIIRWIE